MSGSGWVSAEKAADDPGLASRFLCEACEDWYCVRCDDHLGDCPCRVCLGCGETSPGEATTCESCGRDDGFDQDGDLEDWENLPADEDLGADDPA